MSKISDARLRNCSEFDEGFKQAMARELLAAREAIYSLRELVRMTDTGGEEAVRHVREHAEDAVAALAKYDAVAEK